MHFVIQEELLQKVRCVVTLFLAIAVLWRCLTKKDVSRAMKTGKDTHCPPGKEYYIYIYILHISKTNKRFVGTNQIEITSKLPVFFWVSNCQREKNLWIFHSPKRPRHLSQCAFFLSCQSCAYWLAFGTPGGEVIPGKLTADLVVGRLPSDNQTWQAGKWTMYR